MIGNNIKKPSGTKSVVITDNKTTNVDVSKYNNVRVVADVRPKTYGAVWAGTSDPSWSRTDDAANFSNPNPYYAGMSGSPSSPFDGIMPWAGIRRVTDSVAGELVEIPKFYYKWTRGTNDNSMQLQISEKWQTGFLCSPAHMNRGDNIGERDYIYVGRYKCSSSNYKSLSGQNEKDMITRATARSGIHNLGTSIWQFDFATWWTICMLYLVEYANWDSQLMIGYGRVKVDFETTKTGLTDTMPYHTGTMQSSRTTYGAGTQYRYIEGLWDNRSTFLDGGYCSGTNVYCIKNPASFSDSSGGTLVGTRLLASGYIMAYNNPTVSGFEYALIPSQLTSGASATYMCAPYNYKNDGVAFGHGNGPFPYRDECLFAFDTYYNATDVSGNRSCRLMVLPSQRLTSAT